MKTVAEISIESIGDESQRDAVSQALRVLTAHRLKADAHGMGTELEGELDEVLKAVAAVHQHLHENGMVRLVTTLKLETRTDKQPSIEERDQAVGAGTRTVAPQP
jgi:uncharacterized protein (TIGR00106 family)